MKNWTIGKRILTGFAGIIIIAVALGLFAYARLTTIRDDSNEIATQSLPAIELAYHIQKNVITSDGIIYKHIGSTNTQDMVRLETEMKSGSAENGTNFAKLDKLITNPKERELLEITQSARTEYNQSRENVLVISRQATNNEVAYNLGRTQMDPALDRYLTSMGILIDAVRADSEQNSSHIQNAASSSQSGILIGLAAALFVGIGIALVITRGTNAILNNVVSAIGEGSNQIASASGQVASSGQVLAHGASEQAAALEETSASLEEISSMTKRNAENAGHAKQLAGQTRTAADTGFNDMREMSAAMDAIKGSSDNIGKIIKTIDEIAFQTNILALNAAVEAARAGEAGMGFAVVADEVRNLAQRSAQAAKETAEKIEDSIRKSESGVQISAKVAAGLQEIVEKARKVDELVAEIAAASKEQEQGITQVNKAVSEMDKVTQSNAASAEESASAAEEMSAQSEALREAVSELTKLVGGSPRSAVSAPPALTNRTRSTYNGTSHAKIAESNGHDKPLRKTAPKDAPSLVVAGSHRKSELPMDGDFTEF